MILAALILALPPHTRATCHGLVIEPVQWQTVQVWSDSPVEWSGIVEWDAWNASTANPPRGDVTLGSVVTITGPAWVFDFHDGVGSYFYHWGGGADINGDSDIGTDADIAAFFACLSAECDGADFNNDGDIGTDADIEAFFRVLGGGACSIAPRATYANTVRTVHTTTI